VTGVVYNDMDINVNAIQYRDMHKYELLRLRAEEFRNVLEEYAEKDPDVAEFLQRWMPWYGRICRREIRLPCSEYRLGVYFANPDLSPLVERYRFGKANRLDEAVLNFNMAMSDWLSDPKYVAQLKARGEQPDIVPGEPPPPEEEVPLPTSSEPLPRGLKGWLRREVLGSRRR